MIPHLLVVFARQLEILVTTLYITYENLTETTNDLLKSVYINLVNLAVAESQTKTIEYNKVRVVF